MKNPWLSAGLTPAILLLGSLSTFASAEADHHAHRQHGAHEHGHAKLDIVQEGNTVQLMLESPAANIIGFEHAATTPEEKQKIEKAVELLKQGEKLFGFPTDAQCAQAEVEVESELTEFAEHHDEPEDHSEHAAHHDEPKDHSEHAAHHDEPESHSEFEVGYQFVCNTPAALDTLKVNIFKLFPLTKEIEVQLVTDKRQFATELSSQASTIHF